MGIKSRNGREQDVKGVEVVFIGKGLCDHYDTNISIVSSRMGAFLGDAIHLPADTPEQAHLCIGLLAPEAVVISRTYKFPNRPTG